MTSTAIFAEILVVGLQAMVWLTLLCLWLAGVNGIPVDRYVVRLVGFKDWAPLITAFVIGFAYTLGIIVDRLADSIQSSVEKKFFPKKKPHPPVPVRRLRVMSNSPEITKFLEYVRSRMRIARSTSLNLVLITFAAALLAYQHGRGIGILVIVVIGLVLVVVAFCVSRRIAKTYDKRLGQAYELVMSPEQ